MKRKKSPQPSPQEIPWASATAMRMLYDHKLEKYIDRVRFALVEGAENIQTQMAIDEVLSGIDDIRKEIREYSEEGFLSEFEVAFAPKWWEELLPKD